MHAGIQQHLRHNFVVNVLDGAFFGAAFGFASKVAVIPLFIATLTDSTTIIGLIASLQMIGWQLPQLLTANYVAGLHRYKRAVLIMSIHERAPFLGLALVAAAYPVLGPSVTLALAFLLLVWQALGGGLTATAWQAMICKIMPPGRRGTFYGTQSAASGLGESLCVVIAGILLGAEPQATDFAICFLLASIAMVLSFIFLAKTREPAIAPTQHADRDWRRFMARLRAILARDTNVRWFLVARVLAQFAGMSVAFYAIYAVRAFDITAETAGLLAGVLTTAQMLASPLLGVFGDHWGHRRAMGSGILLASCSALLVMTATGLGAFYIAFALAGVGNAALWTTVMTITADFGTLEERPYYIGLTNTLVAPATLIAPLLGGWLADTISFQATFLVSGISGVLATFVLMAIMHDPRQTHHTNLAAPEPVGLD